MSYIEKQYAVDTGFRMINTNLVNFEDTFFLENIIYNELKARDYEVFTGKTYKGEIDFVAINGRKKLKLWHENANVGMYRRLFREFTTMGCTRTCE